MDKVLEEEIAYLKPCSIQALKYVNTMAEKISNSSLTELSKRFKKLGYSEDDIYPVLKYISEEAPITINFNLGNVLKKFTGDTHYRNIFEVESTAVAKKGDNYLL